MVVAMFRGPPAPAGARTSRWDGHRGRPKPCSATTLRLMSLVPPAIEYEGDISSVVVQEPPVSAAGPKMLTARSASCWLARAQDSLANPPIAAEGCPLRPILANSRVVA